METLDDADWRDADGRDEEISTGFDDYVNELVQFAFRIVVAVGLTVSIGEIPSGNIAYLVFRALPPTWGIRRSTPNGAFLSLR